jgi:hypothetical protein
MPLPPELSYAERTRIVRAFNDQWGEMEQELWGLSLKCREPLLNGHSPKVLEELIWAIRTKWPVQGFRHKDKAPFALALASLDWPEGAFDEPAGIPGDAAEYAVRRVGELVDRSQELEVPRHEYSLAAKTLHFLEPWAVPAYDLNVRKALGIPGEAPRAYRLVAARVLALAREAGAEDRDWLGPLEPRTLVRGLDKCLWWLGR